MFNCTLALRIRLRSASRLSGCEPRASSMTLLDERLNRALAAFLRQGYRQGPSLSAVSR